MHLPEELRQRIYEAAIAGGPADVARGQSLTLESGGTFRAISGGVIGRASAERLLEGVGWLAKQSQERRTRQMSRVRRANRAAMLVMIVFAVWVGC